MNVLVISPHADDAVWSCGGALSAWAAIGTPVTVATVFDADGTPATRARVDTPMSVRRDEDAIALAICGVTRASLGFTEAAMRTADTGQPLYRSMLALRRAPHPADEPLAQAVSVALAPYVSAADLVIAPLGVGTHVDHAIVRHAADRLAAPHRLRYYREFPYGPPPPDGLVPRDYPVEFGIWLRAALAYRTQVEAMFAGGIPFTRALSRYARHDDRGARWQEWGPAGRTGVL
ncbi:PIG-L deacetylase family protein [Micromonospora sp. NPDC050397]|uniref:PIG-L deacetylase family protein n=1 Tax=Micromonospora sp. NPDC050397 TaxID=3364279 RepID=UPI003850606D